MYCDNKQQNDSINGNYAAAVFCQDCDRFTFENVVARNYNGDGFSFQRCDDFTFERCVAEDNRDLGFHPGSGNQRPVMRNCVARGNDQGIFFCWGVTYGLAEDCLCIENRSYGISIGHRDTDNRVTGCRIERNKKIGILIRNEENEYRAAHRNLIEKNVLTDNGFEQDGVGIQVDGRTNDIRIVGNKLTDSGQGLQRIGVRIGANAQRTILEGNQFESLESDVVQCEPEEQNDAGKE